jgi:hypothetical protein
MTQHRDTELLLDVWMRDGPTIAPDRVLDVVVDRIERQGQRPAWRLDWRRYTMNPTIKLAAAALAVVIVALVGYNLLPASSTGVGSPTPTTSPAPTASPSVRPSAAATFDVNGGCGLPSSTCQGSLTAGTHTSRAMHPALTYTVPAGWFNKFDEPGGYGLLPENTANMASLNSGGFGVTTVEVQRDLVVARADCVEGETEPGVGTTASAMVQALAARPGLATTEPAPITVGGLTGFTIDITIAPDWTKPCPYSEGRPDVPLVTDPRATPGTGLHWTAERVTDGSFTRYIILDVPGGGTVLIAPSGPPSFVSEAMPVIESFQFAP